MVTPPPFRKVNFNERRNYQISTGATTLIADQTATPPPHIPDRWLGHNQAVPAPVKFGRRGPKIHGSTLHMQVKGIIQMVAPQNW